MKVNNWTIAIVLTALMTMVIVLAILIYFEKDVTPLAAFMVAAIVPTITSLVAVHQVNKAREQINDVQHKVNGRMTELIQAKTLHDDPNVLPFRGKGDDPHEV